MKPHEWTEPSGFFEILDHTLDLWVVNKPAGWLTHRTPLAPKEWGILEVFGHQLKNPPFLSAIHRLDRATSGVLLLAKSSEAAALWSHRFQNQEIQKRYIALVRGWVKQEGVIEQPLAREEKGVPQPARTRYRLLARTELKTSIHPRYPTARYSFVEVWPESGKTHQIRKHFEHLRHPLVGDTIYGEGRHNRYFRETVRFSGLALHAAELKASNSEIGRAPLPSSWKKLFEHFGLPFENGFPTFEKNSLD